MIIFKPYDDDAFTCHSHECVRVIDFPEMGGELLILNPVPAHTPSNTFITDTGVKLYNVHDETADCRKYGCVIHNPTDPMRDLYPTHWDDANQRIVRLNMGAYVQDQDVVNFERRRAGKKLNEWRSDTVEMSLERVHRICEMLRDPHHWTKAHRHEVAHALAQQIDEVEKANKYRTRLMDDYPRQEARCDRCGAGKGLHAVGESCNNNCGGRVVAN